MRNVFIYIFFICCLSGYSQIGNVISQRGNTSERSQVRLKRGDSQNNLNLQKLAIQITKNVHTEAQKAEAIFFWIASNIEYDTALRLDATLQKQIYTSEENVIQAVLKRKKALCGGYAFLFEVLCKEVGIEAKTIHGYSKKYTPTSRNRKIDHTWNAVKLNGRWQLLDITMSRSQSRTGVPDKFWFATKPSDFIKTHYPEDVRWALLRRPISFSEFNRVTTPR
jgi:transglutaminase/protease-like cytokinesis protein 3